MYHEDVSTVAENRREPKCPEATVASQVVLASELPQSIPMYASLQDSYASLALYRAQAERLHTIMLSADDGGASELRRSEHISVDGTLDVLDGVGRQRERSRSSEPVSLRFGP